MADPQLESFQYQVGGSLPTTARSYVQRQADQSLYDTICRGEFCYILTARQMGKSSLRVRTMNRLQQDGTCCGVLDMTMIGTQRLTPTQWYASLIRQLIYVFKLPINFRDWWKAHNELSPVQCLSTFLREELLEHIDEPIVLFIDEIDALLQLDFSADDFFALIRSCYNNRAEQSVYNRLTFVLIGVAIPSDLIANPIATPFNIGQAIVLGGLDQTEARPLLRGFQGLMLEPEKRLYEVLKWTGGQPFLTQKVCQLVVEKIGKRKAAGGFSGEDLEELIWARVIENWEVQDRPEHLKTVRDRILYNPLITGQVLGLYQQLLAGEEISSDESLAQINLRLSGLVVDRQGTLTIANPIYQAVFDQGWVAAQLSALRPYGVKIEAWTASGCEDNGQLLHGLALKEALAWAATKRLGDLDYRFLAASQEAERQSVESDLVHEIEERERAEFALQAATEATEVLARTQQRARSQVAGLGKWLVGITLGVTSVVALGRWFGAMQRLELGLLDQFFRWRPRVVMPEQSRVVIIAVDEPDIQAVGQFPIPDGVLAQALMRLKQADPRLIGLDIYRDLPVEPGHEDLVTIFQDTPNLLGIEKVIGTPIGPPPALAQVNQVGFADQLFDSDGTVRRTLLSMEPEATTLLLSFPLKLALAYLEQEGVQYEELPQSINPVRLGKAFLKPVLAYDGSYVRVDAGGYQLLLNYVGAQSEFPTFSLTQVLNGEVPEEMIRDRIVLIGSVASTVNDLLITPYTTRETGAMAGVIVHANTISMLLQSALEGRPLLRGWLEWQELLWILLWAAAGSLIAGHWRGQPRRMTVMVGGLLLVLVGGAYGLFLLGWWIPVIPAGISLVAAAVIVPVMTARYVERAILQQTAQLLYRLAQEKPAVGGIAITYLKQSENEENRAWIENTLRKIENQ